MRIHTRLCLLLLTGVVSHAAVADKLYIRADAGYSWTWDQPTSTVIDMPPPNVARYDLSTQSVPEGQLGFGYFWEPYLRFDITGVLTGNRKISATCSSTPSECVPGTQGDFTLNSQELFANVYYELASIWTQSPTPYHPYIGFGLGSAHHDVSTIHFTEPYQGSSLAAEATGQGRWQFAWRATVGIAFMIADNLLLDLSYLYMDAGQAVSGDRVYFTGFPAPEYLADPFYMDVKTQELYLGLRHQF